MEHYVIKCAHLLSGFHRAMSVIRTSTGVYQSLAYANEAELESAILEVQADLFGDDRLYLDVKKKIGNKKGYKNIPDGYLLDLNGSKPRLYVVENELASHDVLKHIAVQILGFSLSFEDGPLKVKKILYDALQDNQDYKSRCEQYAKTNEFRNLDRLLEYLVFESPFSALVIIDKMPDRLENVLAKKLAFGVEILTLGRYEDGTGNFMYQFEPFLADVSSDLRTLKDEARGKHIVDQSELDTVVVPAREEGFKETFVGEDRWHEIRLHGSMRPQIKYIAAYRVSPISAITHIAQVKSIEPWKDTGKYVVNFLEPAEEIKPIKLNKKGHVKAPQSLRYTTRERLEGAKTLDDIW